jgi:hypothetical protein
MVIGKKEALTNKIKIEKDKEGKKNIGIKIKGGLELKEMISKDKNTMIKEDKDIVN